MATTVQEFGPSEEKTAFSSSSDEDMVYAKTFWQSVQLLPPMESRLVSSHVKQRLKRAPPGNQPQNVEHEIYDEPPVLTTFLAKAKAMERVEEMQKLDKFTALRHEDIAMLQKHRQIRIEKEQISRGKGVKHAPQAGDFKYDQDSEDECLPEDTMKDIAEFESRRNLKSGNASDSD